jgi:hypothetical protein
LDNGQLNPSLAALLAVSLPLLIAIIGLGIAIVGLRAWTPALIAEVLLMALFLYAAVRTDAAMGRALYGVVAASALVLRIVLVAVRPRPGVK